MAFYIRELTLLCEKCGCAPAKVEVFNSRNCSQGKCCRACARYLIKKWNAPLDKKESA